VARLVERCLHKDPTGRFQSAVDLKAAILACLAPRPGLSVPSVAVLPFTRMSAAAEDDYLCEGLAEEIINALTRIPGLKVIARTSAFAVSRMGLDVREAGARLDVGHILEGSVRREGRRVRVTAQLVSTGDGSHLWSERYDREMTDVLVLEDEIAEAIAEGRHMIALDPTHFLGHWALGVGLNDIHPGRDAVGALKKAHELSGGIPFTLGFLAMVSGRAGLLDDARRLLVQAEQMASAGYVPPSTFAWCHIGLGDWDAALDWMDRAIEARDPIIMPIKSFPFLDPVRGDARYQALLRKMHLE
jgi:TolB-like protein